MRRCITKRGLKLRDNLLLVAYLDIRESLRSKWFYLYSFVFGGVMGLFFLSGVTDSVVMGFSGLSRLLLVFIQITIVILPNFYNLIYPPVKVGYRADRGRVNNNLRSNMA